MIGYLSLLIAIFLSSCSSVKEVKVQDTTRPSKALNIVFSANRALEMEPRESALTRKLGGIEREWNALQNWRTYHKGSFWFLASGQTFVPESREYYAQQRSFYLKKSRFLVRALNELGMSALGVSANDLCLGMDEIKTLSNQAKFPFLSSNLRRRGDKSFLFQPFLELKHEGTTVYVLSLTSAPATIYSIDSGIAVTPPLEALRDFFDTHKNPSALVVLLSSLSEDEREEVQRAFPAIQIILGARLDEAATFNLKQLRGNLLYLNPLSHGRAISSLQFEIKQPIISFFNPSIAESFRDTRRIWTDRIASIESELKESKLSTKERASLEQKRTKLVTTLHETETVPLESAVNTIDYQYTILEIDDVFNEPKNKLMVLMDEMRKELKVKESLSSRQ